MSRPVFDFSNPYTTLEAESCVDTLALAEMRQSFFSRLTKDGQDERLQWQDSLLSTKKQVSSDFTGSQFRLGAPSDLSSGEQLDLEYALKSFMPWKKGPLELFGKKIDTEWRSSLKWERILPHLGELEGKTIADIGCHNGYFMFKMLPYAPKKVIGFDPVAKLYYNFRFLQKFVQAPELFYEPLGVKALSHFKSYFDRILCMGLLYHVTDPVQTLRDLHASLKKGGSILVDSHGIAGKGSYSLFPKRKYAGAKGVWFVPTLECLMNWMTRAQFKRVQCFYDDVLDEKEQRSTAWAPVASLKDYLDPKDPSLTREGYPAPRRFYLKGYK